MIQEREDMIDCSEANEEAHRQFMAEFAVYVAPIFAQYGMTKGEALNYWILNQIKNELTDLNEALKDRW